MQPKLTSRQLILWTRLRNKPRLHRASSFSYSSCCRRKQCFFTGQQGKHCMDPCTGECAAAISEWKRKIALGFPVSHLPPSHHENIQAGLRQGRFCFIVKLVPLEPAPLAAVRSDARPTRPQRTKHAHERAAP